MSNIELRCKRLTNSIICLDELKQFVIDHPEIRLEQVISLLDDKGDYFNEEPWETLERWKSRIKDLTKKELS